MSFDMNVREGPKLMYRLSEYKVRRCTEPFGLVPVPARGYCGLASFRAASGEARHAQETVRQVETAQPSCDRGARTGAAPVLHVCDGRGQRGNPPAADRRRDLLERGCSLQHLAEPAGPVGEDGRQGRKRHPARVHHHHRHRRHRHGPRGHAVVARVARGHCRHGRADDARPLLRRHRGPRRLRQVAARDDDGDGPAEHSVGLHLRRFDPSGQGACRRRRARRFSPRPDRAGHVRSGRPSPERKSLGRRARCAGTGRLPLGRGLRRPVHRQHHGLCFGSDRPCADEFLGRARPL